MLGLISHKNSQFMDFKKVQKVQNLSHFVRIAISTRCYLYYTLLMPDCFKPNDIERLTERTCDCNFNNQHWERNHENFIRYQI